jgi:hypothetical protein
MHIRLFRSALFVVMLTVAAVRAASAQTCITIDEPHDTLGREERTAALLLVGKQFELAGQRVVNDGCVATYTVSHIRLGTTIIVTLSGSTGSREATALGLDDLPPVYSQMVRSLTSGQPMGLAVLDRTNVSASQELSPRRVQSEGYWYARLGYGSLFGESTQNGAAFGFGYRAEFNRLGLDVSFFNLQLNDAGGYYGGSSSASSLIKLQGLFFSNPTGNRSAYFGGGLSYGRADLRTANGADYPKSGHGAGLQTGLTAGYEIARVTSARLFVQADVTLPLYKVLFETYSYSQTPSNGRYLAPTVTTEREYAPSLVVSVGFGWRGRSR